ncbi:ABC transporter permease, partial [Frankia sp. Mgl5]|uniref:ABC transporter permease n=1 Tax=Frankia sp. Mgl5 TaxID=2933793 RepID=UPI00200CC32A
RPANGPVHGGPGRHPSTRRHRDTSYTRTTPRAEGHPANSRSISFIAFIVIFAIYTVWLGSTFLNKSARILDIHQNASVLLLSLAALVTLIAGLFDLSVASMATLTMFLAIGLRTKEDLPFFLILLICLAVGVGGGLINGVLVEVLHVNTFIATLGTGGAMLDISEVYSGGAQITPTPADPHLPHWFVNAGLFTEKCPLWLTLPALVLIGARLFVALKKVRPKSTGDRAWMGVRLAIVVAAALVLVFVFDLYSLARQVSVLVAVLIAVTFALWVLLEMTSYGRYLRAVGSNRAAATLAGVPVRGTVIRAFVLGGVLSALSGLFLASMQGVAVPNVAGPYLLPAFAASFLSTVLLSVGRFTVWGALAGGVFLVWVSQGLILGGLAPTWTDIVNGAVLVLAVAISTVLHRRGA